MVVMMRRKNSCPVTKAKVTLKCMISHASDLRTSHPEVFCKKSVLRNFAKFTGKHLCQRTWPATLLTKNTFLTEHLRWLLLNGLQTGGLKNDDIFLKITSLQYLWVKRLLKQYSE